MGGPDGDEIVSCNCTITNCAEFPFYLENIENLEFCHLLF